MITPKDVVSRNRNIRPYEAQIDMTLSAPWTEEMKQKGRRVGLRIPKPVADECGVLECPSPEQLDMLEHVYRSGGWVFKPDNKSEIPAWVFEYPKGKTP